MSLEFEKLLPQIQTMGRFAAYRTSSVSERNALARDLLAAADDLQEIWRKIELARTNDAGYRGAAPLAGQINEIHAPVAPPEQATLIAVDGSQVYPDLHASALYYLTNIGGLVFHHGSDALPEPISDPQLYYSDRDIRDREGQLIKHAAVNARRTVQESQVLAHLAWLRRAAPVPLLGLMDGPLLHLFGKDVPYAEKLEADYRSALVHLYDIHRQRVEQGIGPVHVVGYVDRHESRFVVRLLHLLTLEDAQVKRSVLEAAGDFEGLDDKALYQHLLLPGQRSAVMVQQSPQNKSYKQETGVDFEIAFFYLNVGTPGQSNIVRLELPMWVARSTEAVAQVQALVLDQCQIMGRYPYVLARADELAVVSSLEKHHLENLVNVELLKNQQVVEKSPKQMGKDQARGPRQRYPQPFR
ncbi:MAG: DNA double-strand break repair nuclease NurA [Anaerolineae bacterium]|nr:DNA double-strand break repair nuclease NurA [Anaerolineae bacterium]